MQSTLGSHKLLAAFLPVLWSNCRPHDNSAPPKPRSVATDVTVGQLLKESNGYLRRVLRVKGYLVYKEFVLNVTATAARRAVSGAVAARGRAVHWPRESVPVAGADPTRGWLEDAAAGPCRRTPRRSQASAAARVRWIRVPFQRTPPSSHSTV